MKSLFKNSAIIAIAVLSVLLIISARPSVAETPTQAVQQERIEQAKALTEKKAAAVFAASATAEGVSNSGQSLELGVTAPISYIATAYSLRGKTASGRLVSKGIIAADHRVLPLGSRVRIDAGNYSGEYLVADTGALIRGRRIDIWTPSSRDAMRFGRRTVKLTVLSYPASRATKTKRLAKAQNTATAGTAK
jgi:3D (Asp-Asp-Asp) domain-containing protein